MSRHEVSRHDHPVGARVQVSERHPLVAVVYHDAEVIERRGSRHLVRWTDGSTQRQVWFFATGTPVWHTRDRRLLMVAYPKLPVQGAAPLEADDG